MKAIVLTTEDGQINVYRKTIENVKSVRRLSTCLFISTHDGQHLDFWDKDYIYLAVAVEDE